MVTWSDFPFPEWTAYWMPPPSWPRRLLCENRFFCGCSRTGWIIFGAITLSYFLIMDILLFTRFQKVSLVQESKGGQLDEIYTPLTHLSIKAILNDHPSQFINAPSTEYFNLLTHFSSVFSFITPNMISVGHLLIGFIACKFLASVNLQDRRIGAVLYQYRTCLDALDGTVHRAQDGLHLQYHSNHSTFGYFIDSLFDTLGGIFLCFSIFFYLLKAFTPENTQLPQVMSIPHVTVSSKASTDQTATDHGPVREQYSLKVVIWKSVTFAICLAVTSKCWDLVVEDFTQVFQVDLENHDLEKLQLELCHANSTVTIFYLWRLFGGQSVLNYILLAFYMDKVPEFLKYAHYVILTVAVVLYITSAVYLQHIRDALHLPH